MRQTTCALVVLIALTLHTHAQNAARSGADVEKRVESLLGQMTLEEKIDMTAGENAFYIRAIPRLKIPAQKMADVSGRQRKAEPGDFEVLVGPSSARIELRGKVVFRAGAGRPDVQ